MALRCEHFLGGKNKLLHTVGYLPRKYQKYFSCEYYPFCSDHSTEMQIHCPGHRETHVGTAPQTVPGLGPAVGFYRPFCPSSAALGRRFEHVDASQKLALSPAHVFCFSEVKEHKDDLTQNVQQQYLYPVRGQLLQSSPESLSICLVSYTFFPRKFTLFLFCFVTHIHWQEERTSPAFHKERKRQETETSSGFGFTRENRKLYFILTYLKHFFPCPSIPHQTCHSCGKALQKQPGPLGLIGVLQCFHLQNGYCSYLEVMVSADGSKAPSRYDTI